MKANKTIIFVVDGVDYRIKKGEPISMLPRKVVDRLVANGHVADDGLASDKMELSNVHENPVFKEAIKVTKLESEELGVVEPVQERMQEVTVESLEVEDPPAVKVGKKKGGKK